MKEKWFMKMVSIQRDDENNMEKTELHSEAEYWFSENGEKSISYAEPIDQEMGEDSRMEILVQPRSISLRRAGLFQTQLYVQAGKWNFSQYQTPYGDFTVSVIGRFIHDELTAQGGHLSFRYLVSGMGGILADVEIRLDIAKQRIGTAPDGGSFYTNPSNAY